MTAAEPFALVAIELGPRVDPGARAELRTSTDGRTWSPFAGVLVEDLHGPDGDPAAASGPRRRFSEPQWVREARHVQVRLRGAAPLGDVTVHTVATPSREEDRRVTSSRRLAAASTGSLPAPAIVRRAEWGAQESTLRSAASYATSVEMAFVHHSATSSAYEAEHVPAIIRGFQAYHVGTRGWRDIGYNFLVDRFGTVYEGRAGGLERAVVGAQAGGFNTGSTGVCLIGTFDAEPPPSEALEALAALLAWKADVHGFGVDAWTWRRSAGSNLYEAGTWVHLPRLAGHRDVSVTGCPGATVYGYLPTLRSDVVARQGPVVVDLVAPRTVLVDEAEGPPHIDLAARLRPAGRWRVDVRDVRGRSVEVGTGEGERVEVTWVAPAARAGAWSWTVSSPGRRSQSRALTLVEHPLERLATAPGAAAASVEVSRAAFGDGGSAQRVVLVRDDVFADALAAGPLAGSGGPVLLTPGAALDAAVRDEIDRVLAPGGTVYLVGGEAALSTAVVDALAGLQVVRIAGSDRTATAVAVAQVVRAREGSRQVMVARAWPDDARGWADSLAGAAWGASSGVPVLLTHPSRLSAATGAYLEADPPSRTWVLGGPAAIDGRVLDRLPAAVRVAGVDREGTAIAVARTLWGRVAAGDADRFLLGNGFDAGAWRLAVAAAPLAARWRAPLLLTQPASLSPSVDAYLASLRTGDRRVAGAALGGVTSLSDAVVEAAGRLLRRTI